MEEFFVVHLETLEEDLADLGAHLCRTYRYCDALPQPPQLRTGRSTGQIAQPADIWTSEARTMVVLRYCFDFAAFGYSHDPSQELPKAVSADAKVGLCHVAKEALSWHDWAGKL